MFSSYTMMFFSHWRPLEANNVSPSNAASLLSVNQCHEKRPNLKVIDALFKNVRGGNLWEYKD